MRLMVDERMRWERVAEGSRFIRRSKSWKRGSEALIWGGAGVERNTNLDLGAN